MVEYEEKTICLIGVVVRVFFVLHLLVRIGEIIFVRIIII